MKPTQQWANDIVVRLLTREHSAWRANGQAERRRGNYEAARNSYAMAREFARVRKLARKAAEESE